MLELTDDIRPKIVAAARRMVGVRFRHGGRTAQGVDCIGLLTVVYASVGVTLAAPNDYSRRPGVTYAFAQASQFADRISIEDAGPGDIVQMNYAGMPVHFGIISDRGVIHSAALLRKVVEHTLARDGEGRPAAFWRVKGVPAWRS